MTTVHNARKNEATKTASKAEQTRAMREAATKPAPSSASDTAITSKSAFVRALPADLPVAEVVSRAAAQGIDLTTGDVYSARRRVVHAEMKTPTPPNTRVAAMLARTGKRARTALKLVLSWHGEAAGGIAVTLDNATTCIEAAVTALHALPNDYQYRAPKGERGTPAQLEVGSLVDLREKFRGAYVGLIEDAEMVGLKVLRTSGDKHVVLETTAGSRIILKRGQLQLHEEAAS